jgi:hypothetical protein
VDRSFVCTEAGSKVYLYAGKTRLVKSCSACSYKSSDRLHCGKRLPNASFDAESRFPVVCCRLVFLLLVRRVLLCRLKRSVLLQQHSLIHKFMGIINNGREALRSRWTRRGLNAFDWQQFHKLQSSCSFPLHNSSQSSPVTSSKEPVRRASLSICPMCCKFISLLTTTNHNTV